MQFDLYVPRESWLHQLDPRTKLLMALVGLILCMLFQQPLVLVGMLVGFQLLLLTAGIRPSQLRWLWARMLPLTVLILLLQPFFSSTADQSVIWQVGPLRWTVEGVLSAVAYALRVNGMAFAAGGLLFTTEPTTMVRGLVRLGLPFDWGMTVSLAIRYLPTTYGLYHSIQESQEVRGWDPGQGNLLRRLRNYLPTLVAVMIAALRMADNLGMALAARGFGAPRQVPRTMLRDIQMRPADWLVMVAALAILGGAIAWQTSLA